MSEITTAQQNMKMRCQENMDAIRDIIKNRHEWGFFSDDELCDLIRRHQAEIKECVDTNILNRRIRSCGQ